MRRLTYPLAAGVVLSWLVLQGAPPAFAQNKRDNETVKIETVDGVELKGTYWPGNKGKKSPVAILLHKLGGRSNEDGWKELADDLQKAGFAVLTFDFRGHGASTGVNPMTFWSFSHNQMGVKGFRRGAAKLPETIALADFQPRYLPHLVDDVAAAKRFIERRYNDAGECNASSIVLVGAEDGATLGALWLASETKRHRIIPVGLMGQKNDKPESKDVSACAWLNISPTLGTRTPLNVGGLLRGWLKEGANTPASKIPMAFIFGADDKPSDKASLDLVKAIRPKYKRTGKVDDDLSGTVDFGVAGSKLKGSKLLMDPLTTREAIVKNYLEKFIFEEKKATNEWEKRENNEVVYAWYFNLRPIYTNKRGEKHLAPIPLGALGLNP